MALVRPFRALRPTPSNAARVAAPPYDVIDSREARALAAGNSDSFLRISRPEIDLPVGTDEHDERVYVQAVAALAEFEARGVLREDAEPCLYVYAQTMGSHRQVGVVGCASVEEYERGAIKKHENTRPDKEDDRTQHIQTLGAHDEPVFLTYRARPEIDAAVGVLTSTIPASYDFVTADGVRHELWVADNAATAALVGQFASVAELYIADGHHRSAAAARVHRALAGRPGEHDVFPAVLFPHDQMQILAYNRLVRDRAGRSREALLAEIGRVFDLDDASQPAPQERGSFGVFDGERWCRARVRPGSFDAADPVAALDCSILQDQVLGPIFGIEDPRRDTHVDFVGGIRGAAELERRVREQGFALAFHLYPTSVEALIAVSDAGRLMPPKSTWFEPKLRSGLFVHRF